eukprot:jgi/Chlat1/4217/Chrsp27S04303
MSTSTSACPSWAASAPAARPAPGSSGYHTAIHDTPAASPTAAHAAASFPKGYRRGSDRAPIRLQASRRRSTNWSTGSRATLAACQQQDDATTSTSQQADAPPQGVELNQVDLDLPRRRLQVQFTCKPCGARTSRLVNPWAYKRGTVFVMCGGCNVYHKLVDNLGLVTEYDFRKLEEEERRVREEQDSGQS